MGVYVPQSLIYECPAMDNVTHKKMLGIAGVPGRIPQIGNISLCHHISYHFGVLTFNKCAPPGATGRIKGAAIEEIKSGASTTDHHHHQHN